MKLALVLCLSMLVGCKKAPVNPADPEKQFEQMMRGATMVGHSTLDGKDGFSGEERYSSKA